MAFTYAGDPAASDTASVRFLIGDTTDLTASKLSLNDAEIAWLLTQQANVYTAAAKAAMALKTLYRTKASEKDVGDLRIKYESRVEELDSLHDSLMAQGMKQYTKPEAGGISLSDKRLLEADDDLPKSDFYRGMHDTPGTVADQWDEDGNN